MKISLPSIKIIAYIMSVILALGGIQALSQTAFAIAAEGYGSNGKFLARVDPPAAGSLPISDREGLESITRNLNAYYHLTNDIDLYGSEWIPIGGGEANSFGGIFDGQGYVIKNMSIAGKGYENMGLFGYISGAVIKNTGLEGININIVSQEAEVFYDIGGICGKARDSSLIRNCYTTGKISAAAIHYLDTGGICSSSLDTQISYCYNTADLSAVTSYAIGQSDYLMGYDWAHANAGGICGGGDNTSIDHCYNTGNITANSPAFNAGAGGIGILAGVNNCYNTWNISASSNVQAYAAGISVDIWGAIGDCYNSGEINASIYRGAGADASAGASESADAAESATAGSSTAGPVRALAGGIFVQSYPEQADNAESIRNCYNTGNVAASGADAGAVAYAGGIVGNPELPSYISFENCYCINLFGSEYGTRLATIQMRDAANFGGFDFSGVWDISPDVNGGYPFLKNMLFEAGYPEPDSAAAVLPAELLQSVTDKTSALEAIKAAVSGMSEDQKQNSSDIDLVTLYAEEAIAQAASTTTGAGSIAVNLSNIQALQAIAGEVKAAAEQTLTASGVTARRELNAGVKFKTDISAAVTITIDPSSADAVMDYVRIETPVYAISFSADFIKNNAADSPLTIMLTMNSQAIMAPLPYSAVYLSAAGAAGSLLLSASGGQPAGIVASDSSTNLTTYNVVFNKPLNENVGISVPPIQGDPDYQAVMNSSGEAVGGKYNPVTDMLEAKINANDTYTVKENKKDFKDIAGKSNEMQNAINILASKGIINGTTESTFSPDGTISRAEIAALLVRTLSKLDPNADGKFTDVRRSDWYFGAAGSAKKHGIMIGTSATTFAPKVNIPKDQIVAVAARVLKTEMKYKDPANAFALLSAYSDASSLESWSLMDIALATRENLVVKRSDGKFNPSSSMTRGNAAIILYRTFEKIW